jgi:threonine/homoserine/homoserine lactone efflux protein
VNLVVMFLSSLLIAYSGALMPRAMLTMVVAEMPRQGARAGPLVVLGHAILELTLLILLVIGLGPVLEHEAVQAVHRTMLSVAAAFLLVLALWLLASGVHAAG